MADYTYLIVDASTGNPLGEVPLTPTSPYTRRLTGIGGFTATLPIAHPKVSLLGSGTNGDREVTILRDGVVDWNGPITKLDGTRRGGVVNLTCQEPFWYLMRRTIETNQHWNTDIFNIVRALFSLATTKSYGALPNFTVSAGNAGITKDWAISGRPRRYIGETIIALAQDPTTSFDFRIDYATGSSRQTANRTLSLASPSHGVTHTRVLTHHVLDDYGLTQDRERAANRVHAVGAKETLTFPNATSLSGGDVLLETVGMYLQDGNHVILDGKGRELRRLSIPPVKQYTAQFKPSASLPFGWINLGDKVTLNIADGSWLAVNDTRRVVEIAVTPPSATTDELVALTFNLPLDQLGT